MSRISEFANVQFRVHESIDDQPPFIGTRENGPTTNELLDDKTDFLMLLYKGTTLDEAQKLVHLLNEQVRQIGLQRHD